jgi:hypothetical protein
MMAIQDILKRSNYAYSPTDEEWMELWLAARDTCPENVYVNQLYDFWCNRGFLSQKQMFHLVRTVFPQMKNSLADLIGPNDR